MAYAIQIDEQKSRSSITGSWFRVYVNGFCDGRIFSTIEEAQKEAEKIKQKKVYR